MHTKCYLLIGLSNDYFFKCDACNRVLAYIVKYRESSVSCAKTAEPIKMQFGTLSGRVHGICITLGSRFPQVKGNFWCCLADQNAS